MNENQLCCDIYDPTKIFLPVMRTPAHAGTRQRALACATGFPLVVRGKRPETDVQEAEKALEEHSLSPLNIQSQYRTAAVSRT